MRARRDKFLNEKLVIFRMHETTSLNYVDTFIIDKPVYRPVPATYISASQNSASFAPLGAAE